MPTPAISASSPRSDVNGINIPDRVEADANYCELWRVCLAKGLATAPCLGRLACFSNRDFVISGVATMLIFQCRVLLFCFQKRTPT
jgi:hypothetical protein